MDQNLIKSNPEFQSLLAEVKSFFGCKYSLVLFLAFVPTSVQQRYSNINFYYLS
jgi:hypothetical protein